MNNNISTSDSAKAILIIALAVVWAAIQLLILLVFNKVYPLPGTIFFLVFIFAFLKSISGTVKMNECHVLLDFFTKKSRSVFEGFYWKLPWESVQFTIDLEANIDSNVTETFPTTDGSMTITVSIMSKPESGLEETEIQRSQRMVIFVKFKNTVAEMQESRAKEVMREIFADKSCVEAKALHHADILKKSDFDDLATDISIRIIKCPVKDVDYNEEVQKIQNELSKAKILDGIVTILKKTGYTLKEAKALAPLLGENSNIKKIVNDYNLNGKVNLNGLNISPETMAIVHKIISKLGGK